ncbi:MAG: hypothetical protein UT63_C0011G0002 [Candidatus Gottesmanbacteria bacterium GW2011_GWC2_39_8]|uniref:Uncharacterized protein n=1 Tax=Candidatus Gottesmanbacteria bacterium GW2011_GWC2_39_8 TaxID=1618450 RepID=A0A0G0SGI2_9BACT|nr:MAG: hypothetical protein UT63_C0011G0002 [Candidatus Gottesmanbacteria bacterium GW2011_GWC2_39_8]
MQTNQSPGVSDYGSNPSNLHILGGETEKPKRGIKSGETVILVLSSFVMAISLSYSLYAVLSPPGSQDTRSKAAESTYEASKTVKITDNFSVRPEVAAKWQKLIDNVPLNPTQVVATASAKDKTVTLVSGQEYDFPEINFSWTGGNAVEQGTKIIGYYVYLGNKNIEIPFPLDGYETSVNPNRDGVFVSSSTYSKTLSEKGTYYLYVQSVTDSKTEFYNLGLEKMGYLQTLPAKNIFIYKYK